MAQKFGPKHMPVDMPSWRTMVRRLGRVTKEEAGVSQNGPDAQDSYARRISRQLAARTFVTAYISSGFSVDKAYRALRPNATRNGVAECAWRWLKDPYVCRLLSNYDRQRDRNAKLDLQYMMEEAIADAESSCMDFIKYRADGTPYYDIDPRNYTPAQRRRIKGVKIYNDQVVEVRTPDPIAARRQAFDIHRYMQGGRTGSAIDAKSVSGLGNRLDIRRKAQTHEIRARANLNVRVPMPDLEDVLTRARRGRSGDTIDAESESVIGGIIGDMIRAER